MKNHNIVSIVNAGILTISANDLDAVLAYRVIKFKKAVKKALDSIMSAENDILKELGIEDVLAFNKERSNLRESGSNKKRLAELDKKHERFVELQNNLYNEDAKLEDVAPLTFEQFHELQKENRELKFKPLNAFEEILEGVLWEAPNE
jgi:hypothetical protein